MYPQYYNFLYHIKNTNTNNSKKLSSYIIFQLNQQTAFVDASQLYGPTPQKAASLRSNQGGKLKTEEIHGEKFGIQVQRNGSKFCGGRNNVTYCFNRGTVKIKN